MRPMLRVSTIQEALQSVKKRKSPEIDSNSKVGYHGTSSYFWSSVHLEKGRVRAVVKIHGK
jgi:hypothetical protein